MAQFKREESVLASRHRELGSNLEEWNGMGAPWTYNANPCDEHDAYRERAALTDASGIKKIWVTGPDALSVVNHTVTRDMAKCAEGRCVYALMLTEEGTITDDAIVYNMGNNRYLVAIGSGMGMECLEDSAKGKDVQIQLDESLQNLSLQGPRSVGILTPHTPINLPDLKFFAQEETTLFGYQVIISRTGFSGERGYEIYTKRTDTGAVWDKILEAGKNAGVMPTSFVAMNKVRIEFGLLFYPFDMNESTTPWEANLAWAVNFEKADFRGKEAVIAKEGQEKVKLVGLECNLKESATGGEKLFVNGEELGVITGPAWSHRMNKSLALAMINPSHTAPGTQVEARGENLTFTATVSPLPFYDPEKKAMKAS